MELYAAWKRAQRINALIGPRPDIRNQYGDRIEERSDGSVTLTIGDQDMLFDDIVSAQIALKLRGRDDGSWQ